MPKVNRTPPDKMHVQSVLIDKDEMTLKKAKQWCKDHNYYIDGLDETDEYYRFRQYDPDEDKFIYRIKEISEGIKLVLGILKEEDQEDIFYLDCNNKFFMFKIQKYDEEGEEKGYKVKGVMFREGTWKTFTYTIDILRKYGYTFKGRPITWDHSESAKEQIGIIDDIYIDESDKALCFEGRIFDKDAIEKLENGWKAYVSPEFLLEVDGDNNVLWFEGLALSIVLHPACENVYLERYHELILFNNK